MEISDLKKGKYYRAKKVYYPNGLLNPTGEMLFRVIAVPQDSSPPEKFLADKVLYYDNEECWTTSSQLIFLYTLDIDSLEELTRDQFRSLFRLIKAVRPISF